MTSIVIVGLGAVVILIVVVVLAAMHYLRAEAADDFDDLPDERGTRRGRPGPALLALRRPGRDVHRPARAGAEQRTRPGRDEGPRDDGGQAPRSRPRLPGPPGPPGLPRRPRLRRAPQCPAACRGLRRSPRRRRAGRHPDGPQRRQDSLPAVRPRAARGSKKADDADWPSTEWDELSDVDYWAEVASDKPLTTTAQPASGDRSGLPSASGKAGSRPAQSRPAQTRLSPGRASTGQQAGPGAGQESVPGCRSAASVPPRCHRRQHGRQRSAPSHSPRRTSPSRRPGTGGRLPGPMRRRPVPRAAPCPVSRGGHAYHPGRPAAPGALCRRRPADQPLVPGDQVDSRSYRNGPAAPPHRRTAARSPRSPRPRRPSNWPPTRRHRASSTATGQDGRAAPPSLPGTSSRRRLPGPRARSPTRPRARRQGRAVTRATAARLTATRTAAT